jgi:putative heme-binding domain-containing protein
MPQRVLSALLWTACILAAQDHAGQYSQADIERGLRLYGANCALCHGPNGDLVPTVNLRSGKFRHAVSDEDLSGVITAGIPGTAMPPHKLDRTELAGVVAYIRSLRDDRSAAIAIGDATRGRAVFEGKGGCLGCHRVREQGSRVAPDLSEIGATRSTEKLWKSLLDPSAAMLPMHRSVRAVTVDGKIITGRRLNEDTYSVQLIDTEERLVSLIKSDLREFTILQTSTMPSYREKLTSQELSDVLGYLMSLKGVN